MHAQEDPHYGIDCWKARLSLKDEESFVGEKSTLLFWLYGWSRRWKERTKLLLRKHYLDCCNNEHALDHFHVCITRAVSRTLDDRLWTLTLVLVRAVSEHLLYSACFCYVHFCGRAFSENLKRLSVPVTNSAFRTLWLVENSVLPL